VIAPPQGSLNIKFITKFGKNLYWAFDLWRHVLLE